MLPDISLRGQRIWNADTRAPFLRPQTSDFGSHPFLRAFYSYVKRVTVVSDHMFALCVIPSTCSICGWRASNEVAVSWMVGWLDGELDVFNAAYSVRVTAPITDFPILRCRCSVSLLSNLIHLSPTSDQYYFNLRR